MNIRTITSFLVSLAALSGCVVNGGNNNHPAVQYLSWSFPADAGPSCSQAGITQVVVTIDGNSYNVDCSLGQSGGGWQTPALPPGTHSLSYSAQDNTGFEYFYFDGQITTDSSTSSQSFQLQWAVGGLQVEWQLRTSGGTPLTCGGEGVQYVYVQFQNASTGEVLYADPGDSQYCTTTSAAYEYLPAGTYNVYLQSSPGYGNYTFYSATPPVQVSIQAGVFSADRAILHVNLY